MSGFGRSTAQDLKNAGRSLSRGGGTKLQTTRVFRAQTNRHVTETDIVRVTWRGGIRVSLNDSTESRL